MLLYLQTLPGLCNEKTSASLESFAVKCQTSHHICHSNIRVNNCCEPRLCYCYPPARLGSGTAANYREERMLCIFVQIRCYHDSKTHAGIISNAGITFSGYDETDGRESLAPELLSLLPAISRGRGGGSVIKMAPVMGLITIIVSNTRLVFKCCCLLSCWCRGI